MSPIEGKDRIVQALVLGWLMVTQKSNGFKPGDLCVLFEIDSILPDEEWCDFLGEDKRIKSRKFGGALAQGLILPLDATPIKSLLDTIPEDHWEGLDLTAYLGVRQWEPPVDTNNGDSLGSFPSHVISKTDEIRIQSEPNLIKELQGLEWYASVKLDGSSATYLWDVGGYWACSRNMRKGESSHFYQVGLKYGIDKIIEDSPNLVFQGEIVGPGIQGNKMGLSDKEFYVFNIYDRDGRFYYNLEDMLEICKECGLNPVPYEGGNDAFDYDIEDLVHVSKGNYPGTNTPREGIVVRPTIPKYSPTLGGPLSFKVINPDYIMKYES